MKIAILVNDFQPPWDEAGKNNALAAGRLLALKHTVSFIGLGPTTREDAIEGMPIYRTASPGYRSSWKRLLYPFGYLHLMLRGRSLLGRLQPDCVLCFWETASTGIAAHLLRLIGAPAARLVQVVWTDCYRLQTAAIVTWLKEHLPNLLFNNVWLTRLAGNWVDDWMATSQYLGTRLSAVCGRQVTVGAHGVDTTGFSPKPPASGSRPAKWVVGYLGHASHAKGVDVLLEALLPVVAPGELELWLALSDSPESEELKARDLPGVKFFGFLPPAEFYNSCDLMVLPRISSYGTSSLPNTLLEAMACGRPVLTTRQPGIEELVQDGATGFLVAPGDATALRERTLAALEDGPLRERIGLAARRLMVERYSWESAMEPLNRLLGSGNSGQPDSVARPA